MKTWKVTERFQSLKYENKLNFIQQVPFLQQSHLHPLIPVTTQSPGCVQNQLTLGQQILVKKKKNRHEISQHRFHSHTVRYFASNLVFYRTKSIRTQWFLPSPTLLIFPLSILPKHDVNWDLWTHSEIKINFQESEDHKDLAVWGKKLAYNCIKEPEKVWRSYSQ